MLRSAETCKRRIQFLEP